MPKARKPWVLVLTAMVIFSSALAFGNPSPQEGRVVAVDAKSGVPLRAGSVLVASKDPRAFIDHENTKIEIAPYSAVEFEADGKLRLLRGSASLTSRGEQAVRTSSARVDYTGRLLLSYDHKTRSTSAFVLQGEARMVNPHQENSSLRLDRLRGATMVVGNVLPQLIRQLDVAGVDAWMTGYAWPEDRRTEILKPLPDEVMAVEEKASEHLQNTKLEDYFSSIDTADEFNQPDYYDRKFADPDKAVAEANSKTGASRALSPEEAALISLPTTKIDLGFDLDFALISPEQKAREVRNAPETARANRSLASVKPATVEKKKPTANPKKQPMTEQGDPEISAVLERLRSLRSSSQPVTVRSSSSEGRAPSSVAPVGVPDPVYDYSENF